MGQYSQVWQSYVDGDRLMGSGRFDKVAILSYDISEVEAQSPTFKISPEEISKLKQAFAAPENAFQTGFEVGGEKFVTIHANDRSIYGKKGKEGIVIVKAVSCVIVAHHLDGVQTQVVAPDVEKLVDYINGS